MRLREEMPELGSVKTWLKGNQLKKGDLLGKPVLVHFWSVSCPTCKQQLKKINSLYREYNNYLHVIGIHMPRSEEDKDIKIVSDNTREYQINYPVAVDNEETLTHAFGNQSVPSYYIFDESAILRYHQAGTSTMGLFERRIHRIVQKAYREQ